MKLSLSFVLLFSVTFTVCVSEYLYSRTNMAESGNTQNPTHTEEYKVVCYYTNWSQYRPDDGKFLPENVDVSLCTHIMYAFAKVDNGVLAPYEWNDLSTDWSKGMYERLVAMKAQKLDLKILLAVGGWNHGSEPFTKMVASSATRSKFITHAIEYLRKWKFDGLDVDWEYPAARGSPPEDKERFLLLMQELKAAFKEEAGNTGNEQLMLTAAVGAGKTVIDAAYDVPKLVECVDFLSLMGYDLHGSWENVTGINSPLYPREGAPEKEAELCQDWAVQYWLSKGCPASKLVLGCALYGRTFTLQDPSKHGLLAPVTGPGQGGEYTRTQGFLASYEIVKRVTEQGWIQVFDPHQKVYYAYKDNQWVGYDNRHSLAIKASYIKNQGLAGAMVWSFDLDDFSGKILGGKPYPLLTTLHTVLTKWK